MFVFGGVDKEQNRFADLYELNLVEKTWSLVRVQPQLDPPLGGEKPPTSRTFHRAVTYGPRMYILGGFDGKRQNDLYSITLYRAAHLEQMQAQANMQTMQAFTAAPTAGTAPAGGTGATGDMRNSASPAAALPPAPAQARPSQSPQGVTTVERHQRRSEAA